MTAHISLRRLSSQSQAQDGGAPLPVLDYGGMVQIAPADFAMSSLLPESHLATGLVRSRVDEGGVVLPWRHDCRDGGDCMDCATPRCIHETDPGKPPPRVIRMALPKDSEVVYRDGHAHLASGQVPGQLIPLFSSDDGTDMNELLTLYRKTRKHTYGAVFHVYKITEAPSLPVLAGKWLGIPVAPTLTTSR